MLIHRLRFQKLQKKTVLFIESIDYEEFKNMGAERESGLGQQKHSGLKRKYNFSLD